MHSSSTAERYKAASTRACSLDDDDHHHHHHHHHHQYHLRRTHPHRPESPPLRRTWRLQLNSDDLLSARRNMESIHGVDVSWLHHSKAPKEHDQRKQHVAATPTKTPLAHSDSDRASASPLPSPQLAHDTRKHDYFPSPVTPQTLSEPAKNATNSAPVTSSPTPPASTASAKTTSRRPGLLNRASSEKLGGGTDGRKSRSNSWISNISNKFSSSQSSTPERSGPQATLPSAAAVNGNGTPKQGAVAQVSEEAEPYIPLRPKEGSGFFSTLSRKLSAGSQVSSAPRISGKGGVCERRVLNVDPNRERCLVPEMDTSTLRKVAFCVDVEIAGGPRYKDEDEDDEDDQERRRRKKDMKMKERAEGEAMKHPEALKEEKGMEDGVTPDRQRKPLPVPRDIPNGDQIPCVTKNSSDGSPPGGKAEDQLSAERTREKKKKSEDERKERKEKRRRRAEENGSIPVELSMDADVAARMDADTIPSSLPDSQLLPNGQNGSTQLHPHAKRDRPTTDPVRIYRRCCQLRETPILKRITEQLMAPTCCAPSEPGVVHTLDLTGSRLQLADMITLGDWLAVVAVKRLLLEDADLSDEGLRCILAGLLAAKKPEPSKRKSMSPKHRENARVVAHQERSGVIEKLHMKNNPRITRAGWKHISLFLYMCRSLKAIDLSMIQFPTTLPPGTPGPSLKSPQQDSRCSGQETEAAETFFKCLSQRLGGDKLEELILSECGLKASQIRKVVDGAIVCGVNRLGLAGTQLDDEGLDAVLHYLQSGVCGGLDLGGNDLRNKLGLIAEALNSRSGTPCWGLSLAACNLNTASIKPLFSALVKLQNFRFLDLSHNRDLCLNDNGTISLLRRYIGQLKFLKRLHLADVSMSPKQAIALADVLPEGPQLAHLNILENPQLTALAHAKDEANQEEACALYASYMAAVRVSNTLICVDIDVPSPENSEVVKALAKQVVAYSLRNMERFAVAEATGDIAAMTADAAASLTESHGGEQHLREIAVPDVLMHLVGHVEGNFQNHDNDDPAPDDNYIVGGTGVVKALQYVLGEKADDLRRTSVAGPPSTGTRTPRERPGSSAGLDQQQQFKAKKMSKNLLDSARKIRARLQPALAKEANTGDGMAFRRLNFLDQTLQSMIQRFEEEYPETRIAPPPPNQPPSLSSSVTEQSGPLSVSTAGTEITNISDDEDDIGRYRPAVSRHNSDVSLASRALAMEEGHLHRLGQRIRRNVVDSPASAVAPEDDSIPWKAGELQRLRAVKEKLDSISGPELKSVVENRSWDAALQEVGANLQDLRAMQEQDPQGWEQFKEAQMKARMNVAQDARRE
ncbi:MAP-ous protein 1 [Fulvia fulva]|nr:MAP-ous protein 1 [Fulvia fulva]KAK4636989.1 MAP-ous protein 1 [Fulvia fulva]WPV09810.1 MAP-ous protein 1 [Fulvia fulva]WPV24207.1 MAP-ous protein 1 [Fulvia fulva]